jgi:molybdopterin/thiamine biosynthesis adenylyltransferase
VENRLNPILEQVALPKQMPDGALVPALTVTQIEELAVQFGTSTKAIEIAALEIDIYPERYTRNFNTYDPQDQIRLLKSRASVIGLGGLGGTVIEWLSRVGIGHMTLIDGDRFEDHNLNRQLLCTQERIGTTKSRAAAERVCGINSSITVKAYTTFLTSDNANRLIHESDVVVDCLDNIESRFVLETAAKKAGIPLVSAAVGGLAGQVTTVFPQDRGLELIYGPRESLKESKGVEIILGCPPQAVGLIASAQSSEVIKILLEQNDGLLRNKMLLVDLSTHTYETLHLI